MEQQTPNNQIGNNTNPLKKYYRQPKQFVRLPSGYAYYPAGSIDVPESGEVAVYPMTAKDELLFKTPDALLNGEATVSVIQSCIPAIKNAWQMPSLDIDACLIAIRMATYGTSMSVTARVPGTDIDKDFEISLQTALDSLMSARYNDTVLVNNMEIKTQPLNYSQFTKMAIKSFEEQRISETVRNQDMPEEEKVARFQQSLTKLTDLNVSMVTDTIHSITVDGETVSNRQHIKEFIENADKQFYQSLLNHLEAQRNAFVIQPMKITATEDEVKAGAPKTYDLPIQFDTANFFA